MNERRLKIFCEVATILNMTKVAEKMYISQPAVSQAINELETELDVILFDRIGKRLYLTYEGTVFFNYARRLLNLYADGIRAIKEVNSLEKGKLKIGASTTIGIYVLPEIIGNFIKEYKGIEVSIIIENTSNIADLILNNKIDFAFVEGPVYSEEIIIEKFCEDELVFITHIGHPWIDHKIIKANEISKEKIIMREKGSGTRDVFEKELTTSNVEYTVNLELGHTEAIKKAVEAGLGISCISKRAVQSEVEFKKLSIAKIEDLIIKRDFNVIYHKDKYLSRSITAFVDFASKSSSEK